VPVSAQTRPAAGLTIAVHGSAGEDADFAGAASGPFTVEVELLYQPIGFRWAQNLKGYASAPEPTRFTDYYDAMAAGTTATLARATSK
jgi:hypothetical protein